MAVVPPSDNIAATSANARQSRDVNFLHLGVSVRITDVERLREQLESAVDGLGGITLDASMVTTIDAAGLQLLTAFVRDATNAGRDVAWLGVSSALLEGAELLDLTIPLRLAR